MIDEILEIVVCMIAGAICAFIGILSANIGSRQ